MAVSLNTVIQTYQHDTAFHEGWRSIIASRDASIPTLKAIIERFVDGATDLKAFREQIDRGLRTTDTWGATGTGWLMEINKLAKYYGSEGEAGLRRILTGLNSINLGERIEAFRTFVENQKTILKAQGVAGIVSPGRLPALSSHMSRWLRRPKCCYVG